MALPPGVASYGDPTYWEARFAGGEEAYEWCGGWGDGCLAGACRPALSAARRVLVLGAGASSLPFDLADEGEAGMLPLLEAVVATDISPTAVARMGARIARRTRGGRVALSAAVADMTSLPYPAASFDAILEKGTFDVLEVAGDDGRPPDPWAPPPEVAARMHAALGEAHRVLTPAGGLLLSITWAPPLFRRGHYLDDPRYDWGGPEAVVGGVGGAVPIVAYSLTRGCPPAERARWARPRPGERGAGEPPPAGLPRATGHDHMDDEDAFLGAIGVGDSDDDDE